MCGLVGHLSSAGAVNRQMREKIFKQLLLVDTLRGDHSTGIAAIPRANRTTKWGTIPDGPTPLVYKKAMPGPDFLELKTTSDIIRDIDLCRGILGHNRYATQGAKTAENAHPFQFGPITLTHNGTLDSTAGLPYHAVDSAQITLALAEGWDHVTLMEKLEGAFALVWYDEDKQCTYMARNKERPFHFVFSDDGKDMFYASERTMLQAIIERNNFQYTDIWSLKPGFIIEIPDDLEDLTQYSCREFTPKKRVPKTYSMGYNSGSYSTSTTSKTSTPTKKALPKHSSNTSSGKVTKVEPKKDKVLEGLGLSKGDEVEFVLYEAVPYKENGRAKEDFVALRGCTVDLDDWAEVIVHGVDKKKSPLMNYLNGSLVLLGTVLSGREGKQAPMIFVNGKDVISIHDLQQEEEEKDEEKNYNTMEGLCMDCNAAVLPETGFITLEDGKLLCAPCVDTYREYGMTSNDVKESAEK